MTALTHSKQQRRDAMMIPINTGMDAVTSFPPPSDLRMMSFVVGDCVGFSEGLSVGRFVGNAVGVAEGAALGEAVGS
jgi:hypothetical protein